MTRLRSCEGCSRHVFVTERVCPFCRRELAPAPALPAVLIASGMSRAQRLALAAALAGPGLATATACTETTTAPMDGAPIAGSVAGASGAPVGVGGMAVYGAPVSGNPAPPMFPVYGVPTAGNPAPVAGNPAPAMDAGVDPDEDGGTNIAVPVYGAPTPVYGAPTPNN